MVIDMDKCDLETAITRQYSSILKQMHSENQFLRWKLQEKSCKCVPDSLSLVWLLSCKTFSSDLNHIDVDYYSLRRLCCDKWAYLLIPKGWQLRYILLHNIFLEEEKMFQNMLCSIKEENVNPLQFTHKNSLKICLSERVESKYFIEKENGQSQVELWVWPSKQVYKCILAFTWCCKQNMWPVLCKSLWAGKWSVAIFSFITSFLPNFTTSETQLTSACFSCSSELHKKECGAFYWYLRKMKSSLRAWWKCQALPFSWSFWQLMLYRLHSPLLEGSSVGEIPWVARGRQKPCSFFSQGCFPSTDGWKVQWEVKDAVPCPWQCRGMV